MNTKKSELAKKSVEELNHELIELRKTQFSLRMQVAHQQMTKVDLFTKVRRDIARVKTFLCQKRREVSHG